MTTREDPAKSFSDIEKPHETVADSLGDGHVHEPLTVRLEDLWSDLVRSAGQQGAPRSPAALPLLDDMKGILQLD
jgi:hypothetical protein